MKLLYRTAEWHGLAKLRMHTESTLNHLENLTKEFGNLVRDFRKSTAADFVTVELPREAAARGRRAKTTASDAHQSNPLPVTMDQAGTDTPPELSQPSVPSSARATRKPKLLNLFIYKWHALGDYVKTIRLFGGTDSYSTQLVCSLLTTSWFLLISLSSRESLLIA